MLKKWLGAWGKDYQRGCLIQIVSVFFVVPLVALFIFIPAYYANRPGVTTEEAFWIMAIPASIFLFLLLGGGSAVILLSIKRRTNWLDEIFLPMGLAGRSYAITGRQYHGRVKGREVDVFYSRGPMLTIYLGTSMKTQLSIAAVEDVSRNLAGFFNKEPLAMGDPRLAAYAHDAAWGQVFVNQPEVRKIAEELIFEEHPFLFRQLILNPEAIALRLYRSTQFREFRFDPEQGKRWLEQLAGLVKIAESLPAPKETLEESDLNEKARRGDLRTGWIVGFVVAALVGIPTCIGLIAVLVILYFNGGL
jgi:hypothetical protein